jgi:hypothetical protein
MVVLYTLASHGGNQSLIPGDFMLRSGFQSEFFFANSNSIIASYSSITDSPEQVTHYHILFPEQAFGCL